MILNLITKAKELLYKNGKTVEAALDDLNESLDNVHTISYKTNINIESSEAESHQDLMFKAFKKAFESGLTNLKETSFYVLWQNHNHYWMKCTPFASLAYVGIEMFCIGSGRVFTGTYRLADDSIVYFRTLADDVDLANYLPLSGGTVNGQMQVFGGNDAYPIHANRTSGTTNVLTKYSHANAMLGAIGFTGTDKPIFESTDGKFYPLLHIGNYSNFALPLTGGDVSGDLTVYGAGEAVRKINLSNGLRRVYQTILSDGRYALYDGTNDKAIINSTPDGTTTFNGTASGNLTTSDFTVDGDTLILNFL